MGSDWIQMVSPVAVYIAYQVSVYCVQSWRYRAFIMWLKVTITYNLTYIAVVFCLIENIPHKTLYLSIRQLITTEATFSLNTNMAVFLHLFMMPSHKETVYCSCEGHNSQSGIYNFLYIPHAYMVGVKECLWLQWVYENAQYKMSQIYHKESLYSVFMSLTSTC